MTISLEELGTLCRVGFRDPMHLCTCVREEVGDGEDGTQKYHLCFHTHLDTFELLLFIIRVKRELKRVYRNGCRYNERLNAETGGSKTPRIHWVARVNI